MVSVDNSIRETFLPYLVGEDAINDVIIGLISLRVKRMGLSILNQIMAS